MLRMNFPSIKFNLLTSFINVHLFLLVKAQSFGNCDYYKELTPGIVYTFTSPNYNKPYPSGTFCRYTAHAPSGYQINLKCIEVNLPYSDRCSGDRLQVSRAGHSNLSDSDRYCSGPFSTKSFSERLVIALLSPPQSTGGLYRCELYPVKGCDCGRKKQVRIVGGIETDINEFPSMAAIVSKPNGQLFCGASIIDVNYALTAAHCVNAPGRYASDIELLVGEHDYRNPSETPFAKRYAVAAARQHPAYSSEKDINDIAILRLLKPISFNAGVGPVCLPFNYRTASFTGRKLDALGWGTTEFGGPLSNRLQKVSLEVSNESSCESAYPKKITSAQFCTYTQGKDTCNSDSGGPLMYTANVTGISLLYQIGITSYGFYCASTSPSVNTKVSSYLDWIVNEAHTANFCIQ